MKKQNNDIPMPGQTDKEIKEIVKERLDKAEKTVKKPIPDNNNTIIKTILPYYIWAFSITILSIISNVAIWLVNMRIIYKILLSIMFVPITVLSIVAILIKYFVFDKKKIEGKLILRFSHNFIIANFFTSQKRTIKRICLLNPDGITFTLGEQEYTIDLDCVWLDDSNYPNSYYIPNMPNPIKFDFSNKILDYFDKGKDSKVDIGYSAENLKIVKKNLIFKNLHADNNKDITMMLWILIGLVVLSFVTILILSWIQNNRPVNVVINPQNITAPRVM